MNKSDIAIASFETVKELARQYNVIRKTNFIITHHDNERLTYQCVCGKVKRSYSTGRRTKPVLYPFTACPAQLKFVKRKTEDCVRITNIELRHNHEPSIASRKGSKVKQQIFQWNENSDEIVWKEYLQGKTVKEIEEALKKQNISPLPSLNAISNRMTRVKWALQQSKDD